MVYFSTKKIINTLWIILFVLVILSIVSQIYRFNFNAGNEGWRIRMFNLDEEHNLPTYYSAVILFFSALLLFVISQYYYKINGSFKKHWRGLSIIFVYISLDEMISLHEKLIRPIKSLLHLDVMFYFVWLIPGIILLLLFSVIYFRFLLNLPPQVKLLFIASALIYLSGAVGMEIIDGLYANAYGDQNLLYFLFTTLEETLEMIGIIFFLYSLMSYINSLNLSIRFNY